MPRVELSRTAESVYRRLYKRDRKLFARVDAALDALAAAPLAGKPLKGALEGLRSWRVGSHRIVYRFEPGRVVIFVLDIGDRRDAYR